MRTLTLLGIVAVAALSACREETPSPPQQTAAPDLAREFQIGPYTKPIRQPKDGDWLAEHPEKGQTFAQWEAADKQIPSPERRTIYLQPIGPFTGPRTVDLELLRDFTAAYFQLPVVVRDPIPLDGLQTRTTPLFGRQVRAGDILTALEGHLPEDAYCMLGITMEDLYPSDDWNYVFGMAQLVDRTGVFSFARYSPPGAETLDATERRLLTRRAFKVLAHEIGHMFAIKHCTAHHCVMNGSNNLAETDGAPLSNCPVCLRKLHASIGFDVPARDEKLESILLRAGLESDAAWYRDRRAWLLNP